MITIAKLSPADRPRWEELFHGYNTFYESEYPQSMYDRAWAEFQADERMHALGAWLDGELVGITHFFPHVQTTASDSVYLEDLFTAPEVRGRGGGRARLRTGLLAHPRDQRHRPAALRQGGDAARLHHVHDGRAGPDRLASVE